MTPNLDGSQILRRGMIQGLEITMTSSRIQVTKTANQFFDRCNHEEVFFRQEDHET